MPLDDLAGNPVARRAAESAMRSLVLAGLLAACGPVIRADGPSADADAPARRLPPLHNSAQARGVLVGEMCPTAAAGRAGIAPLFVHDLDWSDDADEVAEPLTRGAVRQFDVLGQSGGRAGIFTVMGAADVDLATDVAIGSYSGASACAVAGSDPPTDDPACVAAQHGCGLAIAPIVPGRDAYSELADLPAAAIGTACVTGDALAVDIDGDGAVETYPLAQFLDPVRAPADEITAAPIAAPACKGRFAWFDARVDSGVEPGAAPDPRYAVSIDVVAVVDLDGDGRRELVVAFRSPDHRSLVVYSARMTAARLERVGEALPWQAAASQ
jgi:hypothetical protein